MPEEDYWTYIQRHAREAGWYIFSDGNCLYVLSWDRTIDQ